MSNRELTQAEEDYLANRVQEVLEERAREEAQQCAPLFADWLFEARESDLPLIISQLIRGTFDSCDAAHRVVDRWTRDYIDMRVASADVAELARIRDELMEEFA